MAWSGRIEGVPRPGESRAGESQWLSSLQFARVPEERFELDDVGRLLNSGQSLDVIEGLPLGVLTLLNGAPLASARVTQRAGQSLVGISSVTSITLLGPAVALMRKKTM